MALLLRLQAELRARDSDGATRRPCAHPSARPLSSPEVCDRPMGVGEPKEAEQADNHHLADDRKAVDQEGKKAANNRRFKQIQQVHITALDSPGPGPDHASASPLARVNQSAGA